MSETAVDESPGAAADFAGLMNRAAEQAGGPAEEAPYGYTTDPDGTRRPKKTPGRPRKQPSLDELKAQKAAGPAESAPQDEDRAPSSRRPRRPRDGGKPDKPDKPVVQFREGVIAKGINKLYRRAGKMVRVLDRDIGQALIDITRKDTLDDGTPDPEDVTVGEAWEEIARTNPRIRAFLMKVIAGGAWGQLFMCHAPVLLAVLMKDAIRKRIPFARLMEAFLDDGEDGEAPADGTPLQGLKMPDMEQMMAMAQQVAEQAMAQQVAEQAGATPRPPAPGPAAMPAGPAASGS